MTTPASRNPFADAKAAAGEGGGAPDAATSGSELREGELARA
jgi:hypothetical protein